MTQNNFRTLEELETETDLTVPDGWDGGDPWHSGGGIWLREFQNTDLKRRVVYQLEMNPGVGLEAIERSDEYAPFEYVGIIDRRRRPYTDTEKFEAAVELMEQAAETGGDDR